MIPLLSASPKIRHPYVWRKPGVCGGYPVIRGTRFPVRSVVEYVFRQGMTPDELVREWAYLSVGQVYDALSYYHDHKSLIEQDIQRNRIAGRAARRLSAPKA